MLYNVEKIEFNVIFRNYKDSSKQVKMKHLYNSCQTPVIPNVNDNVYIMSKMHQVVEITHEYTILTNVYNDKHIVVHDIIIYIKEV